MNYILFAGILAALPCAAAAQEATGVVTLGYGYTDLDGTGTDLNVTTFDGRGHFNLAAMCRSMRRPRSCMAMTGKGR